MGIKMRRSSFHRLVLSHLDLLYGAALRATGRRDRAEDLVQETYRIAFDHWRTLREPAASRAWLLRILHNAHIDELRRTRRLVPVDGDAWDGPDPRPRADPERSAFAHLSLERLDAVLAQLPGEARWLFWLREVEGLSYAELSEVFAVPVGTIRSRLARLRERLVTGLTGAIALCGRKRSQGGGGE
jgi:RNA polymerase sigma-70 factor (ECF subfamily)